jgi:DNA-binding CsgD family transcriptional regulator
VFGPLRDLAGRVGTSLTRALRRGDREEVLRALRDEFGWSSNPAVLVIEDAHWADEGTLDALRYLVRRIAELPLVLVLTYRDVEVETGHPLRHVLGLAAGQERTRRLHLAPLSREAVRALGARARWSRTDADEVFAVTSGNPYFVTEILAAGDVSAVPVTIADSVRARTARLGPAALGVVEQLAVVPAAALLAEPEIDVSRVVHHAVQAGDTDAIVHYGRIAAREAVAAGAHREAAYLNLIEHEIVQLRLDDARAHAAEAIGYAERVEFTSYLRALRAVLAKVHLAAGDLAMVELEATSESHGSPSARCNALIVIGRARARRGDAGAVQLLREARDIALRMRESQWIAPATTALAEALVLDGDPTSVEAEIVEAYEQARQFAIPAKQAELVYWLRRYGRPVRRHGLRHPYALLADGRWREAADVWHAAGFRYEYALALSESRDPADHLAALSTLDAIGAAPLARRIRAGLKTLGVSRIPRGPAPRTRGSPAGLTGRQTQVMWLLIEGLTNAEIADALVLSVRTVDSHVAAVLDKLGSRTRRDVAARAADLGLTSSP